MRKFGWIPEPGDIRDKPLSVSPRLSLPLEVDTRNHCTPSENQTVTSSCVGQASASDIEQCDNMDGGYTEVSALFIYWCARARQGWENRDEGCFIRDAIKSMASTGVASQASWPFDPKRVNVKPSDAAFEDAKKKIVGEYYRIDSPDRLYKLKVALASGYPVVFGISVYDSFMSDHSTRTGVIPLPKQTERLLGGHAIKAVGYRNGFIIFQNSWGTGWGENGFGFLPEKFIEDDNLSNDYWVITKGGFIEGQFKPLRWYSRLWGYLRSWFIR